MNVWRWLWDNCPHNRMVGYKANREVIEFYIRDRREKWKLVISFPNDGTWTDGLFYQHIESHYFTSQQIAGIEAYAQILVPPSADFGGLLPPTVDNFS